MKEKRYFPHFDRRHNVNFVSSYTLVMIIVGKTFVGTLDQVFHSLKLKVIMKIYLLLDGINTDYISQNGELDVIYGELNQGRLPYYHRLDLSISKSFKFLKILF